MCPLFHIENTINGGQRGEAGRVDGVCILIFTCLFLVSRVFMGEAPRERRRVRHARRQEEKVSQLLVALLTRHAQQVLGQYLIACITEQHAVSTY